MQRKRECACAGRDPALERRQSPCLRQAQDDRIYEEAVYDMAGEAERMKRRRRQTEQRPERRPDEPGEGLVVSNQRRGKGPGNDAGTAEMWIVDEDFGIVPVDELIVQDGPEHRDRCEHHDAHVEETWNAGEAAPADRLHRRN